ncbi:MAG: gamma-glutamyltransferase [Acidobacteria bacterium]|nr:gamma-glutamyltransferase [Acidobacteriota bacterium]
MKKLLWLCAGLLLCAAGPAEDLRVSRGAGGAVASEEETAARVGIEILKKGGNATDAAVAVSFALAVTWPEAGNLGGGGFWLSRDPSGKVLVVDYREVAPREARRDLYIRPNARGIVPSAAEGPLATGVPGTVAGLALAHRRGGRLRWRDLLEPAIRLARDGFVMTENTSASIAWNRERLLRDPETARIFLPGGAAPAPGSTFRQPDLAATLTAIRDRGEDGFYRGSVARSIEEGQRRTGGLISRGDLARYEAKTRPPVRFRFENAEVLTTPAPSSGPALAEMVLLTNLVGPDKLRPRDASSAHWAVEIEKRAYRDRNRYLGDPAFGGVRQNLFTDVTRLRAIAASIRPDRATATKDLRGAESDKPSTTHFSIVDSAGGAVSVTTTLNDSFGNARVAPGLGFLWNDEMDDFATRPGQKNMYGLVQGKVNAVAPGKRMLSAMCPIIVVSGGRVAFVWGTPGGSTIPTTNYQLLLGTLLRHETLEAAVAAPRFHQQDLPDTVQYERGRFEPDWTEGLRRLGHTVVERENSIYNSGLIGRVHGIARNPDGSWTAVADPRRSGAGLVVRPADASPVVRPAGANPVVRPAGANPVVRPADAGPVVRPTP